MSGTPKGSCNSVCTVYSMRVGSTAPSFSLLLCLCNELCMVKHSTPTRRTCEPLTRYVPTAWPCNDVRDPQRFLQLGVHRIQHACGINCSKFQPPAVSM